MCPPRKGGHEESFTNFHGFRAAVLDAPYRSRCPHQKRLCAQNLSGSTIFIGLPNLRRGRCPSETTLPKRIIAERCFLFSKLVSSFPKRKRFAGLRFGFEKTSKGGVGADAHIGPSLRPQAQVANFFRADTAVTNNGVLFRQLKSDKQPVRPVKVYRIIEQTRYGGFCA